MRRPLLIGIREDSCATRPISQLKIEMASAKYRFWRPRVSPGFDISTRGLAPDPSFSPSIRRCVPSYAATPQYGEIKSGGRISKTILGEVSIHDAGRYAPNGFRR